MRNDSNVIIMHRPMILLVVVCLLLVANTSCNAAISPQSSISSIDSAQQITKLINQMEQAVLAGDKETYLKYVDLTDSLFAIEHQRWAQGWSEQPPASFSLSLDELTIANTNATAKLTMRWTTMDNPSALTASFPVQFHLGDDKMWRYAGEAWTKTEVEHFQIDA